MSEPGTTITSPPTKQTITFVRTAADSGGKELVIEALMEPGASMPPHIHLHQEERFEVLDGDASFRVDGRWVHLGAGGRLTIPPRTPHRFRNESDRNVRLQATLLPALRTEDLFERLFRLGSEGRVNRLGAPGPLQTAAMIREFRDEFFYLAGVPVALQRLLAGARP
jgi:mannose-6-phosphate isomerase-like protein (cupin superfamily)